MINYTEYDIERQQITIKLDTGGELIANMQHEYLGYYDTIAIELDFTDDCAKDLFFRIGGQIYCAVQIILWALDNHGDIHKEEAHEQGYIEDSL